MLQITSPQGRVGTAADEARETFVAHSMQTDPQSLARAWAEAAWKDRDLDAAAAFLTPDWVGHYEGLEEAHGRDGFKRVAACFLTAFPDMQVTIEESLVIGDKLARRVRWTATHQGPFLGVPATGKRVTVREMIVLRIVDGKIAEEWEIADLLGLLHQLGAVPRFQLGAPSK